MALFNGVMLECVVLQCTVNSGIANILEEIWNDVNIMDILLQCSVSYSFYLYCLISRELHKLYWCILWCKVTIV